MKLVQNKHSLPSGAVRTCYFSSIIGKTLFLGALCFGLTARTSWGQVLLRPNPENGLPHGVYSKLHDISNVTTPILTALEDEDEYFGYNPNDWPSYNHDALGTRYNTVERKLSPKTVQQLKVKWSYTTEGNVNATPIVVDHKVYAGDTSGNFYALSQTGQLLWKTKVDAGITASALATPKLLIFGDQQGNIYGLKRQTGAILWKIKPNPDPEAAIYSSPTLVGKDVVIGISANVDESLPSSFRGSVVRLDPETGAVLWQAYTISPLEAQQGGAGASVWSTPSYDAVSNIVYVTTGNNYGPQATSGSDAFIAINALTGQIIWKYQALSNDVNHIPDDDFGDSPQIYRLQNGRKVVGAGQKNGVYDVVDAATGALVNQYQVEPQCEPALGLFADSAVANGVVYANANTCQIIPTGELVALKGDGSGELWRFTSTDASPALSGVAVANGVVYFQVVNADGGFLYALNAADGTKLLELPIGAAAISGPSVADGQVYLGTGVTYPPFITTQSGSIVAFGL